MKAAVMLACLLLSASLAAAFTYKWEDGRGIHFSDDFASVPAELRTRGVPEDEDGVINFGKLLQLQNSSSAKQRNLQEIERANAERDRIVMEAIRQHQADLISQMYQSADLQRHLFIFFTNNRAIWLVPLLLLAAIWLLAAADIMRGGFDPPSSKYLWLAAVLLLPPLGIPLYYCFGRKLKFLDNNTRTEEK